MLDDIRNHDPRATAREREWMDTSPVEAACARATQPLTLRRHAGYDHSYYFVASFMADHLRHHARHLH